MEFFTFRVVEQKRSRAHKTKLSPFWGGGGGEGRATPEKLDCFQKRNSPKPFGSVTTAPGSCDPLSCAAPLKAVGARKQERTKTKVRRSNCFQSSRPNDKIGVGLTEGNRLQSRKEMTTADPVKLLPFGVHSNCDGLTHKRDKKSILPRVLFTGYQNSLEIVQLP